MGGKHLEPIAWREGLHYISATREQWLHVWDYNSSVWQDPQAAVKLLSAPTRVAEV